MTQVLYRKWRPRRWEQVVGQEHVITTLRNAIAAGRESHAYLFSGPRGTGKTTSARLVAKAVNCLADEPADRPCDTCEVCVALNEGRFLDLIEIDAASNTSVDDVRDLRDKINFSPNLGRFKVYIIDEVHMLSTAAFNALLKTLEEPPPHAIFILATTEVHKIPATVLSRCQRHEFRRIPVLEIVAHLEAVVEGEQLEVEPEVLDLVARQATGSLRDAISLLDQLSSTAQPITLGMAQAVLGTAASQAVLDVVDALLAGEAGQGLSHLRAALDAGSDPRQFARQFVDYLRGVMLLRMGNGQHVDATSEVRTRMAAHAQAFDVEHLLDVIRAFNDAAVEARAGWQPGLPLELAFLQSLGSSEPHGAAQPSGATEQPAPEAEAPASQAGGEVPSKTAGQVTAPPDAGEGAQEAADPGEALDDQGVSLHKVHQSWQDILVAARRRNPQTQGLLNSCKPMGIKSGALVLGFATDLIKSKMEKPEHLDHAREALREVLGVELGLTCVVSSSVQGGRLENLGGLEDDGMVAVAVRDLGGEIVDIQ